MKNKIELEHIGTILWEEFMKPNRKGIGFLSAILKINANKLWAIISGKIDIDNKTDYKLTKYFGLSKGFFLRLQDDYKKRMENRK